MFGPLDPVSTAQYRFDSSHHLTELPLPVHQQKITQTTVPSCHIFSGLFFTCRALQHAQEDRDAELRVCFKRAYDVVLRHHHSFVIRSVVSVSDPHGFIPVLPSPWLTATGPRLPSMLYPVAMIFSPASPKAVLLRS